MPRPAKIWRRGQNGSYYAKINGKQERLSTDYQESLALFHKLKAGSPKKKRGEGTRLSVTLEQACNRFLDHARQTKAAKTYENQRAYLQAFCDFAGKGTRVYDLTGEQLDRWCQAQTTWGRSTQAAARRTVMACFNYGVKRKLLLESPMWGMERGTFQKRERILQPEEKAKIAGAVKGPMKDFLAFLELTGCRPFSEAGKLTAAMVDWDGACVPFDLHKNEKKGKRRVIYLAPAALALLRRLAAEHPEGPLFRTQRGNPWGRASVTHRMRTIEAKTGVARISAYCWRHTFITDCLAKGMSPTVVVELVGNSQRTVLRYYAHLEQKKDALREAAARAVS